ncbi:hypothetical protein D0T66_15320 [Dysgonomonas sp. 25]|nr:hypothetical protein [Dysgonomonas sp. 25]
MTQAIIILALFTTISLHGQVTIGSNHPPVAGALLDLTEGATTKKGLGLPRVALTDLEPSTPLELAKSIGNTTGSYDLSDHIGLVVYNQTTTGGCPPMEPIYKGLYVWDGTKWQILGEGSGANGVYQVIDDRDGELYLASNFGTAGDWLLENIRYLPSDGSITLSQPGDSSDPNARILKRYFYPQPDGGTETNPANIPEWNKKYGLLYSYAAVTLGAQDLVTEQQGEGDANPGPSTHIQGICPTNWHIPSDTEWNQLEQVMQATPLPYSSLTAADISTWGAWQPAWSTSDGSRGEHGTAMKSECEVPGHSNGAPGGKSRFAHEGGFSILLAGRFIIEQTSTSFYGQWGLFWTSSVYGFGSAWCRYFRMTGDVSRYRDGRQSLYSVRCKKD